MEIKEELKKFKYKVDPLIESFLDEVIEKSEKENLIVTDALKQVKKITLSGGKRLRPALMYWGYLGVGGENEKEILRASVGIELIHIFLLIHDDVIDKDKTRHGEETIHTQYARIGKVISKGERESEHFGNSMGIVIGDVIAGISNQIIFSSDFPADLIIKALHHLQGIVAMVAIGEAQDVYIEHCRKATEREVMEMYKNKTAKYTIEGPLHLGAILGGAKEDVLEKISKFSVPIGIAFQIQDDILGVFGDERKIGKPVGSDIREGKQTILVVKAMEKASLKQKKIIKLLLGKKDLTKDEIEIFKKVIIDTGSLAYAQEISRNLIEEGKGFLDDLEFKNEAKEFLYSIADYMTEREI